MVLNSGLNIDQANYDGNLVLSIVILLIYLIDHFESKTDFTVNEFLMANGSTMLMDTAIVLFSRSIEYGTAGAVQSIQETKSIIQTILEIIVVSNMPNISQIIGMLLGFVGVVFIIFQKRTDS